MLKEVHLESALNNKPFTGYSIILSTLLIVLKWLAKLFILNSALKTTFKETLNLLYFCFIFIFETSLTFLMLSFTLVVELEPEFPKY